MGKGFDLSNPSDLRRLSREMEKEVKGMARESIEADGVDADCPLCGKPFRMVSGENTCPHCGGTVSVDFDWSQF